MRQERIDASNLELTEKVVSIKRVTKVVKGGRNSDSQLQQLLAMEKAMLVQVQERLLKFQKLSVKEKKMQLKI